MDDAALLGRACRGDESAFSELFARYQRRIYQYASRMCGCAAGDDVVQETFLAVLRTGDRFDGSKGTVGGYLFGIARHHVIRRLGAQSVVLAEPDDGTAVGSRADDESPFDSTAREQTIVAVREAIDRLPPVYREVIVLCDLQEMSYASVAGVIGCPIGTVRSRLHRARALLVAGLADRYAGTSGGARSR